MELQRRETHPTPLTHTPHTHSSFLHRQHFPYFEQPPARPWLPENRDVPVKVSEPTANKVLVSTHIRW